MPSPISYSRRLADCVIPVGCGKTSTISAEKLDLLKEALMWANQMTSCGYVVGTTMSLADIDFMSTVSTLEACNFIDLSPYKNLQRWTVRMKEQIPDYETNCGEGARQFGEWFNASYDPTTVVNVENQ